MKNNGIKNILICPLSWGTGHATRVQVIAGELKKRGHKIIIAAPRALHKTFEKTVYSDIICLRSPSVSYSGRLPLAIAVMFQVPSLLVSVISDRLLVGGLIQKYGIDLIISDNRFGMWSRLVYSIYITHQLRVALPRGLGFIEPLVSAIHRSVAARYDECWIPDFSGSDNLSGMLSHKCRLPSDTRYIGPLCRFGLNSLLSSRIYNALHNTYPGLQTMKYTLAILSGPEPQRTILEHILISLRDVMPGKLVIAAGSPEDNEHPVDPDIVRFSWLDGASLQELMEHAGLIICRSGYSTVMDLFHLGKSALLVPTPGQPEQEYIARYLSEKYDFTVITQKKLSGLNVIPAVNNEIRWPPKEKTLLEEALEDVLKKLPEQAR